MTMKEQSDPTLKYLDSEEVGYDGIELMYQKEMGGLANRQHEPDRRRHEAGQAGQGAESVSND